MADLDHIFHPYHKLSYKKVVKRADNNRMVCKACVDEISSEHYSCEECKFFLHKLFAQRPSELTHSLHPQHPQHPLRLLHYYPDLNVYCDSCGKRVDGFIYHCEICKFSLDFICAFPDGTKLNHVCHPDHVLTYENEVKRDDKGAVCAACLEEISLERYSCGACHFHLHKACAERPRKLKHPLHPYHDLDLHPISYFRLWTSKTIFCDACRKRVKGFIYHCNICCFDLDFLCAFSGHSKFYHVCHPQHVLTLGNKAKKERVVCAACLEEISGQSAQYYSCRPCNFFLHKVCAEKPSGRIDYPYIYGRLELLPKSNNVDAQCDVCKNRMEGFVYRCRDFPFQVDFACSFPDDDSELKHVCHPGHKFTRENVVKRADKALNCAACLEEISGPLADYYSCRKCNFFLHGLCFQRPWELTTPLHPEHPLRLLDEDPYSAGTGYCSGLSKVNERFCI